MGSKADDDSVTGTPRGDQPRRNDLTPRSGPISSTPSPALGGNSHVQAVLFMYYVVSPRTLTENKSNIICGV